MRPSNFRAVRWLGVFISFCATIALLTTCRAVEDGDAHAGIIGEIQRAGLARAIGPRLSIGTKYRPCSSHPAKGGTIPVTRCEGTPEDGVPPEAITRLLSVSRSVPATTDPDTLHAIALLDLLWAADEGISLNRSISFLQSAVRLSDRPGPVLVDLAAAHLVRAEKAQSPRDLLEAIEAATRALELEPGDPAAHFNLALALDHLALDGEAAGAWEQLRSREPGSGWAREAEGRIRALLKQPTPPEAPATGASAAEVEALVGRAPQDARLLGWDRVLGEWGEAALAGDTARAAERLRLAGVIGQALESRGGDATLADAVRAIRTHAADAGATVAYARAHRDYSAGRRAFLERDFTAAGAAFERTLTGGMRDTPLRGWTTAFTGATLGQNGEAKEAERLLRGPILTVDTVRYPALAAQLRWARGMALVRDNRSEEGLILLRVAAGLFERVGEIENVGAVEVNAVSAEYALGDVSAVHRSMHRTLTTLRGRRASVWLHNLLYISADAAAAGGLGRAAVRIQNEGVNVAVRTASPANIAEAQLARARLLTAQGHIGPATVDVAAARPLVEQLPAGVIREWLTADLKLTDAGTTMRGDPRRAEAALDSVIAFFSGIENPVRLIPALIARADARLSGRRVPGAEADLDRALDLLEEQHAATATASLRGSLLDAARGVVDRLVMLRIAAGRAREALAYLERGRASLAPVGAPRGEREEPSAPAGHVGVEYALVGDTLLVWTVQDTTIRLTRRAVDRGRLTRTIENARSALELRQGGPGVKRDLAALYDLLVRPVESQLGPVDTPLLLVADGEIAAVPLPALYDSVRRRYFIEDHPLRFATSLRDARNERPASARGAGSVLLVADPAFDGEANLGLERLPGARAEVEAIAREYPKTEVLSGAEAARPGLAAALRGAAVLHYAGHAVFDDDRPLESHLVLAPTTGEGTGHMTAAEIEQLDLTGLRLVVLSACWTARGHGGRSGGFAGLTGALIGAGAGGVVGSLWRVDDDLTRVVMVEFHRAYRRSGDAAGALRAAQLHVLQSTDPARRLPAVWAAFRYVGV